MIKVNVGLSRKLSHDYNSTGFSLNLEGELCVAADDPQVMIEKIKEYYDIAEEALNQQIERYESDSAIGSHDENRPAANGQTPSRTTSEAPANSGAVNTPNGNGNSSQYPGSNGQPACGEAATNK